VLSRTVLPESPSFSSVRPWVGIRARGLAADEFILEPGHVLRTAEFEPHMEDEGLGVGEAVDFFLHA
jgi:hypothetical protein